MLVAGSGMALDLPGRRVELRRSLVLGACVVLSVALPWRARQRQLAPGDDFAVDPLVGVELVDCFGSCTS
jgi:hypothetical protein